MKIIQAKTLQQIWADILVSELPLSVSIESIVTDTRKIIKNAVFFAITGDNFDGNQFIKKAFALGANWIVGEQSIDTLPKAVSNQYIQVTNTRLALGKIAQWIRQQFNGLIFGLTGSAGKTTAKEMLASICKENGNTYATKGNLNNDLGVPFTWFCLPNDCDYAVIEMGANHQKEIAYLSDISNPSIAMVTNAGQAHLEGFGGIKGVAKGKGELYENLTEGQVAIINADDEYADYWIKKLTKGVIVYLFGSNKIKVDYLSKKYSINLSHCVWVTHYNLSNNYFEFKHNQYTANVTLPIQGMHNISNALGAITCGLAAGFSLESIKKGLTEFNLPNGRLQTHTIEQLTIIDDSYNANPTSVKASADILSSMKGHRIMVLGDMAELGDSTLELHKQLGKKIIRCADQFLCLGTEMKEFVTNNNKAIHFEDSDELVKKLVTIIDGQWNKNNITVLIKGSRSMKMEEIAQSVQKKYENN